ARGYVLKSEVATRLIGAIEDVLEKRCPNDISSGQERLPAAEVRDVGQPTECAMKTVRDNGSSGRSSKDSQNSGETVHWQAAPPADAAQITVASNPRSEEMSRGVDTSQTPLQLSQAETTAAQAIVEAQAKILDLANDAIFIRSVHGRLTYWNAGAER